MIGKLVEFIRDREPALVGQVVAAGLGLAVVYGLDLPEGGEAAIVALVVAAVTFLVRRNVTPETKTIQREVVAAGEAAARTAIDLGRDTVGAVGEITEGALDVVADVVDEVTDTVEDDG